MRWSEALAGIARTGLGFTESLYERERFEEVLSVAADMRVAAGSTYDTEDLVAEWMRPGRSTMVRCGRSGPVISMRKISLAKALP